MTRRLEPRRSQARRLLVPVGLLGLVAILLPMTAASAGPRPVVPTATSIAVTDFTSSVGTPATDGSPADLVAKSPATFRVLVQLQNAGTAAPLSATKDTVVQIAVTRGATTFVGGTRRVVVTAGGTTADFAGLALGAAANDVQLTVTATSGKSTLSLVLNPFDVFSDPQSVDASSVPDGVALSVSRAGLGNACHASPDVPTCADLVLPSGLNGTAGQPFDGQVFFATGICDGSVACPTGRDLLMVLAQFTYQRTAPATIIYKCDKTACGGGGVPGKGLLVSLAATGALQPASACTTKGVVNADADFCIDYAQSKRDGAGDLHLYLLLTRDARMSAP